MVREGSTFIIVRVGSTFIVMRVWSSFIMVRVGSTLIMVRVWSSLIMMRVGSTFMMVRVWSSLIMVRVGGGLMMVRVLMVNWSWCGVGGGQVDFVGSVRAVRVVVVLVVLVVSVIGRQLIMVSVLWLLRIAEPWSVTKGARLEYLREGFLYEVAVRLWIVMCWFVVILVVVTRFVLFIVIILILIIIIVFTGRITKSIAVTRMVLNGPVHISPTQSSVNVIMRGEMLVREV